MTETASSAPAIEIPADDRRVLMALSKVEGRPWHAENKELRTARARLDRVGAF
jgi:hypothetical protein